MNDLYFPPLVRKPEEAYHSEKGGFYAASNYQSNYEKVAEDCLHRCVYCDATEKECGGERFSLDHFRPQFFFENKFDGVLVRHPHNLHLACQKCNVLKSKDWKGCLLTIDGPTYSDGKGYIDRFKQNIFDFIEVDMEGRLKEKVNPQQERGPGEYVIRRLHLNRPTRIYLRQLRHVNKLVGEIESMLSKCTNEVIELWNSKAITPDEGMARIKKIQSLRLEFQNLSID